MYTTVLFDIDGTLIDTENVIITSLQKTLWDALGLEKTAHELSFALGIPGKDALKQLNIPENLSDDFLRTWSDNAAVFQHKVTVFPHIATTLASLQAKNIQLGLVTSKMQTEFDAEFSPFNLNHFFHCVVTASDTERHKPNPDPVLKAISHLSADPEKTIYIGDSIYDMKSAKSAGIDFGLALWGAKNLEQFTHVDHYLKAPEDILSVLNG